MPKKNRGGQHHRIGGQHRRIIQRNAMLSKNLVFKGGTVLKKAYFEDYRFSEDLDFTLLKENITNDRHIERI